MTPAGVDKYRVVQVIARGGALGKDPRLGSGYLAGRGLVLTSAHAVHQAETLTVRRVLGPHRVAQADAGVAWIDADPYTDLAVLRLTTTAENAAEFPADLAPPRYGRVDGPADCEAVGFPCSSCA